MTTYDANHWQTQAEQVRIPSKAWINGMAVDALSGTTRACINPATEQPLAQVSECQPEDADLAVTVAREAFNSGPWAQIAQTYLAEVG